MLQPGVVPRRPQTQTTCRQESYGDVRGDIVHMHALNLQRQWSRDAIHIQECLRTRNLRECDLALQRGVHPGAVHWHARQTNNLPWPTPSGAQGRSIKVPRQVRCGLIDFASPDKVHRRIVDDRRRRSLRPAVEYLRRDANLKQPALVHDEDRCRRASCFDRLRRRVDHDARPAVANRLRNSSRICSRSL